MKEFEVGINKIKFFDSPDTLPIKRFQKFNKYMMIDSDVGSTFEDFLKRDRMVNEYLSKGLYNEAKIEMGNRTQAVFNSYNEYMPRAMALATLVYSINGDRIKDLSGDGLNLVLDRLDNIGYTKKDMDETISKVKKKSKSNLFSTFLAYLGRVGRKG